ncbi:hypothetical protein KI387_037627 [Taxus chinensis]|uniref:protein-serine/threonine phosphatase n=1 Tax=Taxus chinensis TaxID=29808 RepID=A0AA38FSH9_TAXCH|nr:hypothetical protein KI387_037627 [Taxus chinensis]
MVVCSSMHKHAIRRRRLRAGFQRFSFVDGGDDAGGGYFRRSAAVKNRGGGCCGGLQANDGNSAGKSRPSHGCVSLCGRRREMEDATAVVPSFFDGRHFFAVYDGHGGSRVALRCADRLHQLVAAELDGGAAAAAGFDRATWGRALKEAFLRMDAELCCRDDDNEECMAADRAAPCTDGSTAVVAVIGRDEIAIANCGDSRAVISRGGAAIPLTRDHKPDRADRDGENRGGGWTRNILERLSRAGRARHLTRHSSRCAEDECLILASDGLWDVVSNETACEGRKTMPGRSKQESRRAIGGEHQRVFRRHGGGCAWPAGNGAWKFR